MSAKGVVIGPDGIPLPSVIPPEPLWRRAFRYFRLSQTSDDLFDAYRNMWLCFESMLSDIVPPQVKENTGKPEPDRNWLKRAYPVIKQSLDSCMADDLENPLQTFYEDQYEANRCALFHAKVGNSLVLPGELEMRKTVGIALEELSRIVMVMMREHIQVQRLGGFISPYGFTQLMKGFSVDSTIAVTASHEDPESDLIGYRERTEMTELATTFARTDGPPSLAHEFVGAVRVSKMRSPIVNAVVAFSRLAPGIHTYGVIDS